MTNEYGRKLLGLLQVIQCQQFLPLRILIDDVWFALLFVSIRGIVVLSIIIVAVSLILRQLRCGLFLLLLLPRDVLCLLSFRRAHLRVIRLLILIVLARGGIVVETEVDPYHLLGRSAVVRQSPDLILEFEELAVGAQGDFAHAVHVEVKLILVEVLVVFDYSHVFPQTSSKIAFPPPTIRQFELVPRALHIIKIPLRRRLVTREQRHPPGGILLPPGPQQRPRGEVVDVSILTIQIPSSIHDFRGPLDVSAGFEQTGFELVKVHGRGRVLDAPVDEGVGQRVLGCLLVQDGTEVPRPQQTRGRALFLFGIGGGEDAVGGEGGDV
mmetsp:Transcript_34255/g.82838  ORF Transcript_34255/g.82838 Transcript_34255/m.82838 type:complete len:325 (-) Transcript_34255:1104-2078(-)